MSGTADLTGKSPSTRCRPTSGRFRVKFLRPSNPTPRNDGSRKTRPVPTACRKSCRSEPCSRRESRKGPQVKAVGRKAVDQRKAPLRSLGRRRAFPREYRTAEHQASRRRLLSGDGRGGLARLGRVVYGIVEIPHL